MHSLRSFLFILYFNADQMLEIDFQSFKTRILTKLTIILHATRIIIILDMTYQQFWGEFRSWKIFSQSWLIMGEITEYICIKFPQKFCKKKLQCIT